MKKVTLTLKGEIGTDITLEKIKKQISNDTEEVLLLIDSNGGYLNEAFSIFYYFEGLKDIKIRTEILKNCHSSATLLALIPDNIEDRVMDKNANFLIHLPYIQDENICALDSCNADYLQQASDYARLKEDCMIDVYKHKTNLEEGVIRNIMIQNKPLNCSQSEAYYFIKTKQTNTMFQKIVNLFKSQKIKASVDLETDKGLLQLSSEDLEDGIGSSAFLNGEVAENGEYFIEDKIITVENGIVTEIKEVETEEVILEEEIEIEEVVAEEVIEEVIEEVVAVEAPLEEKEEIKPIVAKTYIMPTINPNKKVEKMNQKQEFTVFAQNILAKAGAKMKNGEFVVKANALTSGLTYSYNGIEDLREIFFKPTIETPEVQSMFEILYGVKSGQQLFSVNALSNIVKKSLGNCDATPTSETTTVSARKLETTPLKVELRECAEVFNGVVFEYWLKAGAEKGNLEGTEIEAIIMKVVTDAIRRDVFRILSFGNTASVNANFNQLDGLWTRLFAGEVSGDVVKVDTITALNTGNPTANAEYYLRRLEQGATMELRGLMPEEKAIYTTQNVYDNYLSMLETRNATESAFKLMLDGSRQLTFRGIPVIGVPAWDNNIAILGGTDTLMVYTTKQNHVVGIDGDNSLQEVKFVYDVASDKNIVRAKMSIGYNYKTGGLQAVSYGNI